MAWKGSKLRTLRDEAGLTRRELMFQLRDLRKEAGNGKKPPAERTLLRWEEGDTAPSAEDLVDLATVLKCDVADLFTEEAA